MLRPSSSRFRRAPYTRASAFLLGSLRRSSGNSPGIISIAISAVLLLVSVEMERATRVRAARLWRGLNMAQTPCVGLPEGFSLRLHGHPPFTSVSVRDVSAGLAKTPPERFRLPMEPGLRDRRLVNTVLPGGLFRSRSAMPPPGPNAAVWRRLARTWGYRATGSGSDASAYATRRGSAAADPRLGIPWAGTPSETRCLAGGWMMKSTIWKSRVRLSFQRCRSISSFPIRWFMESTFLFLHPGVSQPARASGERGKMKRKEPPGIGRPGGCFPSR